MFYHKYLKKKKESGNYKGMPTHWSKSVTNKASTSPV